MDRDDQFGTSLALVDGDLVLDTVVDQDATNGSHVVRRLRMVAGRDNLIQALELRVFTPFGTDLFNTTYGTDFQQIFTPPDGLRATKILLTLNLVRTLATDPRVQDVREVAFEDDPRFAALHPGITKEEIDQHRRQRVWRVDVVIETVTGETAALALAVGG
jgi:hypothetical protein